MLIMEIVKPLVIVLHLAYIPAIVEVVAANIRQCYKRRVCLKKEQICHGRISDRIHLVDNIV